MGKRKKTDHGFDVIVQEKNLPPLVLDQKWHQPDRKTCKNCQTGTESQRSSVEAGSFESGKEGFKGAEKQTDEKYCGKYG